MIFNLVIMMIKNGTSNKRSEKGIQQNLTSFKCHIKRSALWDTDWMQIGRLEDIGVYWK